MVRHVYRKGERVNCCRCYHEWHSRTEGRITVCPSCHSAYFDQERGEHYYD